MPATTEGLPERLPEPGPDEKQFLMRMNGGPFPGTRRILGVWPLPDEVPDQFGRGTYVKVGESMLAEDVPGVVRGAEYDWRPKDGGDGPIELVAPIGAVSLRADMAISRKWNHVHRDGTTVAHEFGEGCDEPVTFMDLAVAEEAVTVRDAKAAMLANILRVEKRDIGSTIMALNAYAARQFERDIETVVEAVTDAHWAELRSHSFPHCQMCGTAVDDPEAFEHCAGPKELRGDG